MPHTFRSRTLSRRPTIPAHIRAAQDRMIHLELIERRKAQERANWQAFDDEVKTARRKPRTRYKAAPVLWPGDELSF